jgi:dCTP deaminase
MILSDQTIGKRIKTGDIRVYPKFEPRDLRPTGLRFHLGGELLLARPNQIAETSALSKLEYETLRIPSKGFTLPRGGFVLGSSAEMIQVSRNLVCWIEPRSTIARLGLSIHMGSTIFDNIHEEARSVTLELFNGGPFEVKLHLGMEIGMFVFAELAEPISRAADDQYSSQRGATAARPAGAREEDE